SLHYAEAIGLRVLGLVLNHLTEDLGEAGRTNLSLLKETLLTTPLHESPHISDLHDKSLYIRTFDKLAAGIIKRGLFSPP
ncbi:MAG: hypothetical protein OEZ36_03080, partial [Spirochaetota bacterium]|nr:hypothetical protein [Spirochaetota bacterium]